MIVVVMIDIKNKKLKKKKKNFLVYAVDRMF